MRLMYVEVSMEWLVNVMKGPFLTEKTNIPEDAQIVRVQYEPKYPSSVLQIILESAEFLDLSEGTIKIPRLDVICRGARAKTSMNKHD